MTTGSDDNRQMTPTDGLAIQEAKPKLKKPKLYKVVIVNDDYTPMEFVVMILQRFFGMPQEKAVQIMLAVHQKGMGVCGVFTCEIAEMKVMQVLDCSREHQHPLQCRMEQA